MFTTRAELSPGWVGVAAALLLLACAGPEPGSVKPTSAQKPAETGEAPKTSLRIIIEPFPDFYFQARAQLAGVGEALPLLQPVADAYRPVDQVRGSWGGYWRFDVPGLESQSPDDFAEWFSEAPETVKERAGTVPIREPGQAMARAMKDVWPQFLSNHWPHRRDALRGPMAQLRREFMPKHQEALRYMLDSLGIENPKIEVPMYLVLETHPPGASTYRSYSGPLAVLSTNDLLEHDRVSDLAETLLHETCHVLDLASKGDADAFSVLRKMLEARGITRQDPRHHDVPHLIMFVQSEETMRRLYNPDHLAYGDTPRAGIAPLYERSGAAADYVRRHWRDFLDGNIDRETALTRIADDTIAE